MKIKDWIHDEFDRWHRDLALHLARRAFDAGYVSGSKIELVMFDGRRMQSNASIEHQQECFDKWVESDAE